MLPLCLGLLNKAVRHRQELVFLSALQKCVRAPSDSPAQTGIAGLSERSRETGRAVQLCPAPLLPLQAQCFFVRMGGLSERERWGQGWDGVGTGWVGVGMG